MKLKFNQKNHLDTDDAPSNLLFGFLGEGIIIWDKNVLEKNSFDYMKIAHIDENRYVQYFGDISEEDYNYIENYAFTANPRITPTKGDFVFKEYKE